MRKEKNKKTDRQEEKENKQKKLFSKNNQNLNSFILGNKNK